MDEVKGLPLLQRSLAEDYDENSCSTIVTCSAESDCTPSPLLLHGLQFLKRKPQSRDSQNAESSPLIDTDGSENTESSNVSEFILDPAHRLAELCLEEERKEPNIVLDGCEDTVDDDRQSPVFSLISCPGPLERQSTVRRTLVKPTGNSHDRASPSPNTQRSGVREETNVIKDQMVPSPEKKRRFLSDGENDTNDADSTDDETQVDGSACMFSDSTLVKSSSDHVPPPGMEGSGANTDEGNCSNSHPSSRVVKPEDRGVLFDMFLADGDKSNFYRGGLTEDDIASSETDHERDRSHGCSLACSKEFMNESPGINRADRNTNSTGGSEGDGDKPWDQRARSGAQSDQSGSGTMTEDSCVPEGASPLSESDAGDGMSLSGGKPTHQSKEEGVTHKIQAAGNYVHMAKAGPITRGLRRNAGVHRSDVIVHGRIVALEEKMMKMASTQQKLKKLVSHPSSITEVAAKIGKRLKTAQAYLRQIATEMKDVKTELEFTFRDVRFICSQKKRKAYLQNELDKTHELQQTLFSQLKVHKDISTKVQKTIREHIAGIQKAREKRKGPSVATVEHNRDCEKRSGSESVADQDIPSLGTNRKHVVSTAQSTSSSTKATASTDDQEALLQKLVGTLDHCQGSLLVKFMSMLQGKEISPGPVSEKIQPTSHEEKIKETVEEGQREKGRRLEPAHFQDEGVSLANKSATKSGKPFCAMGECPHKGEDSEPDLSEPEDHFDTNENISSGGDCMEESLSSECDAEEGPATGHHLKPNSDVDNSSSRHGSGLEDMLSGFLAKQVVPQMLTAEQSTPLFNAGENMHSKEHQDTVDSGSSVTASGISLQSKYVQESSGAKRLQTPVLSLSDKQNNRQSCTFGGNVPNGSSSVEISHPPRLVKNFVSTASVTTTRPALQTGDRLNPANGIKTLPCASSNRTTNKMNDDIPPGSSLNSLCATTALSFHTYCLNPTSRKEPNNGQEHVITLDPLTTRKSAISTSTSDRVAPNQNDGNNDEASLTVSSHQEPQKRQWMPDMVALKWVQLIDESELVPYTDILPAEIWSSDDISKTDIPEEIFDDIHIW